MEAPHLTHPDFWSDGANYIATHPLHPTEAEGLSAFAADLGASGWCFFQTSGSEGRPKWVGLEKAAFLTSARAVNAHFHVTAQDRWLIALPLHHVGGFSIQARCAVSGSSAITFPGPWDATAFAQACLTQGITLTSLVPTQVHDLVTHQCPAPPTLRIALIGGGALSPALRTRAAQLGWPICTTYGMTEAASQIATESSSGGLEVLPHWQLSTDETDTLTLRGPALAKGYALRAAAGSWLWQPIDPAAGLRTRDRVCLTTEGTRQILRFLGRDSDALKICGELVSRDALQARLDETALRLHFPGSALLVPLPDPRRETSLTLAIESGPSTPEQRSALLDAFNTASQPHERAFQLRVLPVLPRTSIGKPDLLATQRFLTDPPPDESAEPPSRMPSKTVVEGMR